MTNTWKEGAAMLDPFVIDFLRHYRRWTQDLARKVWAGQWHLLDRQCRAGIRLLDTILGTAVGKEAGPEQADRTAAAQAASSLEERARQRTRQGLAPPREIYDVRNRDRVDWSTLPEWARPSDPDLFEGCAHEG
jgi:hypothetical protein